MNCEWVNISSDGFPKISTDYIVDKHCGSQPIYKRRPIYLTYSPQKGVNPCLFFDGIIKDWKGNYIRTEQPHFRYLNNGTNISNVTHWMFLPEPPK